MEKYNITGMSCAACSARVEKAVSALPGVSSCAVNLLTNSMGVEGNTSPAEIISAVEKAGYGASLQSGAQGKNSNAQKTNSVLKDTETPKMKRRLLFSLCLLLPLMYISMGHTMWGWVLPDFLNGNHIAIGLCQLLLSAAVMVINQKFFINGFMGLIRRAPNMDTLVALGSFASFIYSTTMLFAMTAAQNSEAAMGYMHEFYFESAAMILTLITVGKMLEARSKGKTTDALQGLMNLAPKTAVLIENGEEKEVPVEQIKKGDIFAVRPGMSIPVDGTVLEGGGAVDESALTGESIPVDKASGDSVSAATINRSGFLVCRAEKVGKDTALSQIIRMVSDAAATKAPISKTADKVSGIFVPTVIGIAAVTFAIWIISGETTGFALARAISVLVISCPCALGLATPVAIMVGSGKAAKNGILFKTAASLEETGKVKIVVLDKTGTITKGEPKVTDIIPANGFSEDVVLSTAYALEQKSEHPLAKAVVSEAELRGFKKLSVDNFAVVSGSGVSGTLDGAQVFGGNLRFIEKYASTDESLSAEAEKLSEEGKTPLFFCKSGVLIGIIAVADMIKEDSPKAISELKALGIHTVMLTGDSEKTAAAIAKQVRVDEVVAGVLPDDKAAIIKRLREHGKVAMVGDGINDAPALTVADSGIAIGAGTDIAIDAADVVLMKSSLRDAAAAIRLSRAVLTNIRENLFWAFFYNIIGIPLAAGLWIPIFGWTLSPMFGAAAMSLSSFCVVTNALRLNLIKLYNSSRGGTIKGALGSAPLLQKEQAKTIRLKIEGMMCSHCESAVKAALEAVPNVENAMPDHIKGEAILNVSSEIPDDLLLNAIQDSGYELKEIIR